MGSYKCVVTLHFLVGTPLGFKIVKRNKFWSHSLPKKYREKSFLLQKDSESQSREKNHFRRFLEIKKRKMLMVMDGWRKRDSDKNGMVVKTKILESFPGIGESKRKGSKRNVQQ